jgi:hypothetical protein
MSGLSSASISATCKECHIGPDVPAFTVDSASKHSNIFS